MDLDAWSDTPDPFARQGRSSDTVRYTQAFTLNAGKRVVKAVSIDPHNRAAEPSSVSTRNYVVAHADEVHGDRDGVRAPPHTQKWTTTARKPFHSYQPLLPQHL